MIWTLTRKEFHDNLLTFRFTFGTLILILLVLAITLANVKNFKDLNQEYMFSVQETEKKLKENRVYSTIRYTALKPPEVLSIFNLGVTNRLGNSVLISRLEVPTLTKKYTQENPLLNIFSSLDLTLVYKIVISLLALLFAFDAISGEKEKGTLRLLLSQRVSRIKIILGKYFGNLITMAVSFLISLLIGFIVLIIHFPNLSGDNWLRIFIFVLFTLLYISIFLILGLLLSSLTRKSSHTLIFCLFFWIFFVIIIPNLSVYLATVIRPVPPEKTVKPKIQEINTQLREKTNSWRKQNRAIISYSGGSDGRGGLWLLRTAKETVDFYLKYFRFVGPLSQKRADDVWRVKQDYYLLLKKQENLAALLSRISPSGLFQNATEMTSRTDVSNYEKFIQQAAIYRESIFNYLRAKDAFTSLRFFTVMEEKNILPYEEYKRKKAYQKPDGDYYEIEDFPPLNLDDFPRFDYQQERLSDILPRVISYLIAFILISLALFIGSAAAFNFYDVR